MGDSGGQRQQTRGGVGLSWQPRDEQLARLGSSRLMWELQGEQMRGRWSREAVAATEVRTRVAPAALGEAVRFWAQFEEGSLGFTMVWGPE